MADYRCIQRLKTKDGKIHEVGEIVSLDGDEAHVALSFRAVVPVPAQKDPDTTSSVQQQQPAVPQTPNVEPQQTQTATQQPTAQPQHPAVSQQTANAEAQIELLKAEEQKIEQQIEQLQQAEGGTK